MQQGPDFPNTYFVGMKLKLMNIIVKENGFI